MAVLAVLIGLWPLSYLNFDVRSGLLSTKSAELLASGAYRTGFISHIAFGGLALLTGWPQFFSKLRVRNMGLHRRLGKIYVVSVALGGAAALAISPWATGGPAAQAGFVSLAVVWLLTTRRAYAAIRQKSFEEHEKWMIFSFAATFAAVTLRIWLPLLIMLHEGAFEPAYRIVAWLCWLPNMAVAALLVSKKTALG